MSIPGLPESIMTQLGSVRRAYPTIVWEGQDVTEVFGPCLTNLSFSESFKSDELADTVSMELADPEALLRLEWSIRTHKRISLSLVVDNWNGPGSGQIRKNCGQFFVTEVRIFSDKGSGTRINLACSSIDPASDLRLTKKTRAWSNTTLKDIAAQIASDNKLGSVLI